MKALIDRILKEGKCYEGGILKVDKFINHQMDPNLMKQVAVELIRRYASTNINKILTVEASGIAPAIMMGFLLDLPVVFAKKKKLRPCRTCSRPQFSHSQSNVSTMFAFQKNTLRLTTKCFSLTTSSLMAMPPRV